MPIDPYSDQISDYVARPPLGLRPKYIADAMRAREIIEAIDRYMTAGKAVPSEWVDELKDLICNAHP